MFDFSELFSKQNDGGFSNQLGNGGLLSLRC